MHGRAHGAGFPAKFVNVIAQCTGLRRGFPHAVAQSTGFPKECVHARAHRAGFLQPQSMLLFLTLVLPPLLICVLGLGLPVGPFKAPRQVTRTRTRNSIASIYQVLTCRRVPKNVGCVIAQAFFSRGASEISLKSRFFSAELSVI